MPGTGAAAFAGAAAGLAVSLKQTQGIYLLALLAGLVALAVVGRLPARRPVVFAGSATAAFLAGSAYWMWKLLEPLPESDVPLLQRVVSIALLPTREFL